MPIAPVLAHDTNAVKRDGKFLTYFLYLGEAKLLSSANLVMPLWLADQRNFYCKTFSLPGQVFRACYIYGFIIMGVGDCGIFNQVFKNQT